MNSEIPFSQLRVHCKYPQNEEPVYTWAVHSEEGRFLRDLSEVEVAQYFTRTETWVLHCYWIPSLSVIVQVGPRGFHLQDGRDFFPSAVQAVEFASRGQIHRLEDPRGWSPLGLRVRYHTGGVHTEIQKVFFPEEIEAEAELLGENLDGGHLLMGWTYSFGALRHAEKVREVQGIRLPWEISGLEREQASDASFRATLALLREVGTCPIRQKVRDQASRETPYEVQVKVGNGPWYEVGPTGELEAQVPEPLTPLHKMASYATHRGWVSQSQVDDWKQKNTLAYVLEVAWSKLEDWEKGGLLDLLRNGKVPRGNLVLSYLDSVGWVTKRPGGFAFHPAVQEFLQRELKE